MWDVLTQLSFTTLVAFPGISERVPYSSQIIFSVGLLTLTEILYRFTGITGFDQPFSDQHNFGNYADLILMRKIVLRGYGYINCIPTAAHTIWGVLAGKLLLSDKPEREKVKWLLLAGLAGLVIGYGMDVYDQPYH